MAHVRDLSVAALSPLFIYAPVNWAPHKVLRLEFPNVANF
jgi:hypothetical protein